MKFNLSKQLCDERRQQILDATEQHVIHKGFHKTSMQAIAKSANLSVGQIYRYFNDKDDIICALVEQTTKKHLSFMSEFLNKKDWLNRHFSEDNEEIHCIRIMTLEIKAEASRNTTISKICKKMNQHLRSKATDIIMEKSPGLSKAEAIARVEVLSTLAEGMLSEWDYTTRPFTPETIKLYNTLLDSILPD